MLKSIFPHNALRILGITLLIVSGSAHADSLNDPPSRVAQLNYTNGDISFSPAGSNAWLNNAINRPILSGDRLWVPDGSKSELHIGSTALRLGGKTNLDFANLRDDIAQINISQGELNLRVRRLSENEVFEIDTPNLAFVVQQPGSYHIRIDPNRNVTAVTIWQGRAIVYGGNNSLVLDGTQQVRFIGADLSQLDATSLPSRDSFDMWAWNRDRAEDNSIAARYVSRDFIGYEQLDTYGTWQQTSSYGPVWVPNVVAVGWAPYRAGHWSWISPWGWTWIDDAPWGFAPYHYGRWAYLSNTWCWVPGATAIHTLPVYAPALVAFVTNGHSGNTSWSLSIGASTSPGVAWLPLGPGEIYRPAYATSPRYISNINKTVIVNNNTTINQTIVNNVTKTVYVNQTAPNALTAIPVAAFVRGKPVASNAQPMHMQQIRVAQSIGHAVPIAPTTESIVGMDRHAMAPPVTVSMRRNTSVVTPVHFNAHVFESMRPIQNTAQPSPSPLTIKTSPASDAFIPPAASKSATISQSAHTPENTWHDYAATPAHKDTPVPPQHQDAAKHTAHQPHDDASAKAKETTQHAEHARAQNPRHDEHASRER